MSSNPHPMQQIELDSEKTPRFSENEIVRTLLDHGIDTGLGLNELRVMGHLRDWDWLQFYQLIGYSVSGYGDAVHHMSDAEEVVARADKKAEILLRRPASINVMMNKIVGAKNMDAESIAELRTIMMRSLVNIPDEAIHRFGQAFLDVVTGENLEWEDDR